MEQRTEWAVMRDGILRRMRTSSWDLSRLSTGTALCRTLRKRGLPDKSLRRQFYFVKLLDDLEWTLCRLAVTSEQAPVDGGCSARWEWVARQLANVPDKCDEAGFTGPVYRHPSEYREEIYEVLHAMKTASVPVVDPALWLARLEFAYARSPFSLPEHEASLALLWAVYWTGLAASRVKDTYPVLFRHASPAYVRGWVSSLLEFLERDSTFLFLKGARFSKKVVCNVDARLFDVWFRAVSQGILARNRREKPSAPSGGGRAVLRMAEPPPRRTLDETLERLADVEHALNEIYGMVSSLIKEKVKDGTGAIEG